MKIVDTSELEIKDRPEKYGGLALPQVRVLHCLASARKGAGLSRAELSRRIGNKTNVVVTRAVGYVDPDKRAAFEQTNDGGHRPSLLTLGYVEEYPIDIDGVAELVVRLTDAGRKAFEALRDAPGGLELPPLNN